MCARATATLTYLGQNRDEVMKYVEYSTVIKWSDGSQYLQNGYKPVFRSREPKKIEPFRVPVKSRVIARYWEIAAGKLWKDADGIFIFLCVLLLACHCVAPQ